MTEKLIDMTLDTGMMIQNDVLCDGIYSPTLCIGKDGSIFSANQGACDLSGYHKSEIAQLNSNYEKVIDALKFHDDQEALKSLPATLNLDDLANYQLGERPKVRWVP